MALSRHSSPVKLPREISDIDDELQGVIDGLVNINSILISEGETLVSDHVFSEDAISNERYHSQKFFDIMRLAQFFSYLFLCNLSGCRLILRVQHRFLSGSISTHVSIMMSR